jgi:hypothetical protein
MHHDLRTDTSHTTYEGRLDACKTNKVKLRLYTLRLSTKGW